MLGDPAAPQTVLPAPHPPQPVQGNPSSICGWKLVEACGADPVRGAGGTDTSTLSLACLPGQPDVSILLRNCNFGEDSRRPCLPLCPLHCLACVRSYSADPEPGQLWGPPRDWSPLGYRRGPVPASPWGWAPGVSKAWAPPSRRCPPAGRVSWGGGDGGGGWEAGTLLCSGAGSLWVWAGEVPDTPAGQGHPWGWWRPGECVWGGEAAGCAEQGGRGDPQEDASLGDLTLQTCVPVRCVTWGPSPDLSEPRSLV